MNFINLTEKNQLILNVMNTHKAQRTKVINYFKCLTKSLKLLRNLQLMQFIFNFKIKMIWIWRYISNLTVCNTLLQESKTFIHKILLYLCCWLCNKINSEYQNIFLKCWEHDSNTSLIIFRINTVICFHLWFVIFNHTWSKLK